MNRAAAVTAPETVPFNFEMLRFDAERWDEITDEDDGDCAALRLSFERSTSHVFED